MSLAGQLALTSHARAAMLACDRHLRRDDLRLDRGHELFRLGETKPEVGQTGLFIAFEACDFHLRLPGLQLRYKFDPPNQLRHQLTLVP
jgi:hypothetical protein